MCLRWIDRSLFVGISGGLADTATDATCHVSVAPSPIFTTMLHAGREDASIQARARITYRHADCPWEFTSGVSFRSAANLVDRFRCHLRLTIRSIPRSSCCGARAWTGLVLCYSRILCGNYSHAALSCVYSIHGGRQLMRDASSTQGSLPVIV